MSAKHEGAEHEGLSLVIVGPMPPPVHGQSVVISKIVPELSRLYPRMRLINTGALSRSKWLRPIAKAWTTAVAAFWSAGRPDVVYVAVKAEKGMWLTAVVALLARLGGARIFLHHHSYLYVRERKKRMVALTHAAGPNAHHIVLSKSMGTDLRRVMPEIQRVLVINNSQWIDQALVNIAVRTRSPALVLGHLSNLTPAKGVAEVVDLAVELKRIGRPARLVIGGPTHSKEACDAVDRASRELGDLFDYRGPLSGEAKCAFFEDITHFAFPSRNEALPLVLYEAMASGVVCLTTRVGSIPEQTEGSSAVLAESADSFVTEIVAALVGQSSPFGASEQSRTAYLRARTESDEQLAHLLELISGR